MDESWIKLLAPLEESADARATRVTSSRPSGKTSYCAYAINQLGAQRPEERR